nr:MAG TPA: hypothetical protein [Caudoviricetes sp.]
MKSTTPNFEEPTVIFNGLILFFSVILVYPLTL